MTITSEQIQNAYARAQAVNILRVYKKEVDPKLVRAFVANYKNRKYFSNIIKTLGKYNDNKERSSALASLCRFYCDMN